MRKLLMGVLLIGLAASCTKELPFEGKGKKPLLVLNCILVNHEPFQVNIARSVFFLSNQGASSPAISDAVVTLTNVTTGEIFVLNQGADGDYIFPFDVAPNTTYKIVVTHPDYPTISSELTTVSDIVMDDVDTSSVQISNYEREKRFVYQFNDLPGSNFYIAVFRRPVLDWQTGDTLQTYGYGYSTDPSNDDGSVNTAADIAYEPRLFFNDELFSNQYKNFEVRERIYNYDDSVNTGYEFTLINATEDTYKYFKSAPKNLQANPLADPVKVHNNILGGYGIFGSISYSTVEK